MTLPPAGAEVPGPDPEGLAAAARALGIDCTVEVDGRLAVLVPTDARAAAPDAATRRELVAAARHAGFSHVALALPDAPEETR